MNDLSSPEMQRTFRSLHRLDVSLYLISVLMLISCVGLIVVSLLDAVGGGIGLNWAQICYLVLLAFVFLYTVFVLIFNLKTRKPCRKAILRFVADLFYAQENVLKAGKCAELAVYLIGDRLTVTRQGCEEVVYIDLAPVKKFYGVCAYTAGCVKAFLKAYYAARCGKDGYYTVTLTDAVGKKPKVQRVVEEGKPAENTARNAFIRYGLIRDEQPTETNAD